VQHAHITLVDDIDGTEATETVSFMLDGAEYIIDLSDEHAGDLREELRRYIEVARRTGGRATRRRLTEVGTRVTAAGFQSESSRIREWAAGRGISVNAQGRIPQDVIDAYRADQARPAKAPAVSKSSARRGTRTAASSGK
jgi:nucleoid-associated protein Lsr2